MKNDPFEETFLIPHMKSPEAGPDTPPLPGAQFPTTYPFEEKATWTYGWRKYFINFGNFIHFPRDAKYINMEVMVEVLKGKMVDLNEDTMTKIDHEKWEDFK